MKLKNTTWFFWATLLLWFFTVGIWLHRLNDALSKFDPLFIIPLLQCNFVLFAIISGGIFFKEMRRATENAKYKPLTN